MKETIFGKNLKLALVDNGITQKQLAEHLKTTQATVSRWIKGINEPDLATFLKICLFLNENPNDLLGFN